MMYNEATLLKHTIPYEHYGILSNDNTYAIHFNPNYNRHPYTYFEYKPVKFPQTYEHTTKTETEPPVALTDGKAYLHQGSVKPPPLLPPYLKKPEDLGLLQSRAWERNKGDIIYGHTQQVIITNNVY